MQETERINWNMTTLLFQGIYLDGIKLFITATKKL